MAGTKHVGIIDEHKARVLAVHDQYERQRLQAENWQKQELTQHQFIKDDENSVVINRDHQLGRGMDYKTFERKLTHLPGGHNFVFIDNNSRPFRGLYWSGGSKLLRISCYGKAYLPEFSIFHLKMELKRDYSVRHISPLDMPDMVWGGISKGFVPKDPDAIKPGWKKTYLFQGENADEPGSRGWRKVLIDIVAAKIGISPEDIEAKFGRSDRKSWARNMGYKETESIF